MSRITKAIAEDVARQLVAPKLEVLKVLKSKLTKLATEQQLKAIPKEVIEVFKKHPSYFRTATDVRIQGSGINQYVYCSLTEKIPVKNSNYNCIQVSDVVASKVVDLDDKVSDQKKAIERLKTEIEIALINLRTYNNVQKEFPEAFALLPVSKVNTALAININSIRKEIK